MIYLKMGNGQQTPQKSPRQLFDEQTETERLNSLLSKQCYEISKKVHRWESPIFSYSCDGSTCDFTDALKQIEQCGSFTDNQRTIYKGMVETLQTHQLRFVPFSMDSMVFTHTWGNKYYKYWVVIKSPDYVS
jgi:hypothetical protein